MSIKTIGVESSPKVIVEKAVQHYKDNQKDARKGKAPFWDDVWVVFDRDEHVEFETSIERCRSVGIGAAFSNPCFELWLILHDSELDGPLTRHEAQKICRERNLFMSGSDKRPKPLATS